MCLSKKWRNTTLPVPKFRIRLGSLMRVDTSRWWQTRCLRSQTWTTGSKLKDLKKYILVYLEFTSSFTHISQWISVSENTIQKKIIPRLIKLINSEGEEWQDYLKPSYKIAMDNSISYVATADDTLCGYSRSISDSGLFIWSLICSLIRILWGHAIGKQLMECILKDFPKCDVYVMSDVDGYYQKLGYEKEGSIFKVKGNWVDYLVIWCFFWMD